MVHTTFV